MLHGILLINKPAGLTSHDVVDKLRKLFGQRRIGHAGTLDPSAVGLLVVLLGQATKLSAYLAGAVKEYTGTMVLGVETDTLDADGRIVKRRPCSADFKAVKKAAKKYRGEIEQRPPLISAVRVGGRRLHKMARRGEAVVPPPRRVHIFTFNILKAAAVPEAAFDFQVVCSKGTYVRSLVADLGRDLGCGAHLARLKRLRSGEFELGQAVDLDEVDKLWRAGLIKRRIISPAAALADWPRAQVDAAGRRHLRAGRPLPAGNIINLNKPVAAAERLKVVDERGKLICLATALVDLKSSLEYGRSQKNFAAARPFKVFL